MKVYENLKLINNELHIVSKIIPNILIKNFGGCPIAKATMVIEG
jgi:hypothetical protein